MVKKLTLLILSVVATTGAGAAMRWTDPATGINWTYIVSDGKASIGGGKSYDTAVPQSITGVLVVPAMINGYPVTSIGDYAFFLCSKLTSVRIPDSVTSIGPSAFGSCSGLVSVTIPNSTKSIGSSAFGDCSSLESIVIPGSVTNIGYSAFTGCSSLTGVTIANGVRSIGEYAFSDCDILQSVTIPDSVVNIGHMAFRGCGGLTSVVIGCGVARIGAGAFSGCSMLTSVKITDIAKWCGISFGDSYANPLSYAHNLYLNGVLVADLSMLNNVAIIRNYAFSGCSGLTNVQIPSGVTSIGSSVFSGCSGLTSVTIPDSVTRIGDGAFFGCEALSHMTIPDGVTSIGCEVFSGCSSLTAVTMPNGITRIGEGAFYGCLSLAAVTIPDSVTSIGEGAFSGCNDSLFDITTIPGLKLVDSWAVGCVGSLSGDMNLTAVRGIADGVFSGCNGLTSVTIPQCVCSSRMSTIFPDSYQSITELTVANGVMSIGPYAFNGCSGLVSVTISDSVTSIAGGAFNGCGGLEKLTLPFVGARRGITENSDSLFGYIFGTSSYIGGTHTYQNFSSSTYPTAYCISSALKKVVLTDETAIGYGAFSGCNNLVSVTIPDSVTSIGDFAFDGCSRLESVVIGNNVTNLGWLAFNGCDLLFDTTTIIGVKLVDGWAVGNTGSLSGRLDLVGLRGIAPSAFSGCSGLTSVTIPESVVSIGASAFSGCNGLEEITLPFVGARRGNSDGYDALFGYIFGTSYYADSTQIRQNYSSSSYSTFYIPLKLKNVRVTDETILGYGAFSDCGGLMSVAIPASVTNISKQVFSGCSGLVSVAIPQCICNSRLSMLFPDSYHSISNIIIDSGVTYIGDDAFSACTGLASVTIPDSIMGIGYSAFSGCSALTSVHITDIAKWCSISFGDSYANPLSYAHNLYLNGCLITDLMAPDNLTSVMNYAFFGCSGLTSVSIPKSVTSIGDFSFSDCIGLTNVAVGSSVTQVGRSAFSGCNSLTSVAISVGVTSIASNAFKNCNSLTCVAIPDSVTDIGDGAFSCCSSLTAVMIGNGVTTIGKGAFESCNELTSVYVTDLSKWCGISFGDYYANPLCYAKNLFLNGEMLTDLVVPDSVTSIGDYAFFNCAEITSVTMPDAVTNIGSFAFSNCRGILSFTVDSRNANYKSINGLLLSRDGDALLFGVNGDVVIPSCVTSIGSSAFYGCSGLASVTIPDSVTNIGSFAFHGCSGLVSVTIPNTVTSIGSYSFSGCSGLASITIPDSVSSLGPSVFDGCSGLEEITLPFVGARRGNSESPDSLFGYIFGSSTYIGGCQTRQYYSYSSLSYESFCIPLKLKKVIVTDETAIGYGAFSGCQGLASVTIPSSVARIGYQAFARCSGLEEITLPFVGARRGNDGSSDSLFGYVFGDTSYVGGVQTIQVYSNSSLGYSTFYIPSKLKRVNVTDETLLGHGAFENCNGLTSVTIPNAVNRIGSRAFRNCSGLTCMVIPGSVMSIGDSAFSVCSELMSVVMPESVTNIGLYAFIGCDALTNVYITDLSRWCGISFADYYANPLCYAHNFYLGNDLIGNLTIPNTVTTIGNYAFSGCDGLTSVTISDNVSSIGISAFSGCSGLKNITLPNSVTNIGSQAFYGCSGLKSVTIPDGVTRIGHQAFYGCSGLSSIIIPSGVTSIGGQAFSGCRGLASVEMPDSVTSIDNGAFQNCSNLTRLTLPDNVMSIEDGAFDGCTNLVDMRIPNGVTNIGSSAFSGCSRLTSVTIPCGVTIINSNTFYGCSGLTGVTISDGVKSIGERAFEECIMLKSITIPESVTNIENYAFLDCSKLNGVTILGSVTNIGNYVFWGCDELTNVYLSKDYSGSTSVFPSSANIIRYAPRQTVTLDANGGAVAVRNVEVTYGRPYGFIRVPFRDGYSFDGWTLDGEMILEDTIVTALDDHVIVAQWTAKEYDVKFNSAGGVVGMASKTVKFDSRYGELPTASCDGYVFLGWMLNGEDVCAETVVKTTGDHTLTAKWGVKVGSGIWMTTICDEPITLGAPHVPPTGEVLIPASIAGRTVVGITAEAFAGNNEVTAVTVRLAVNGVADGVLPYVPLTLIVDDNTQVIPDVVRENVRKAVFADGVTMIGDNYFAGCPNLEEFDIADTVIRIGKNVFEAASSLKTVVQNGLKVYQGWCLGFSDGVDHVGRVMLPDGVRGIAPLAFKGNFDIVSVGFSSGVRFVGAGAFRDCTGIEDVVLPEGVVVVDREAFRNCTYVQSLTLPTTLVQIGAGAFANATSLAGVTVPEGVADIGAVAFSNCWRMMSAEIPASVTNIGVAAFADCRRLAGVTVPLGLGTMSELFPSSYDKITSVRVVTAVDVASVAPVMDAGMFAGCEAMVALTLPESLTKIADDAFVGCTSMATFELPDSVKCIGARAFKGLSQLTAFEFPDGLVSVGDEAFSACAGISALMLPKGIERIGERAFSGLSLLSRTDIPASVTSIGAAAFGDCSRVRAISLPGDIATVATIWPGAYRLITSAEVTARAETAPYQIIDSLFEGCEALVVVELPLGVTKIGARAFAACTSLTDAGIPFGVTSLGKEVFSGCVNLSNVSLPTGLRVLSSRMFEGCESLNEVIVPESVGTIGESVFYGCSSLRAVAYVGNAPEYNAAAYAGVPAAMVTKVVNGSMGWDGIATSKSLPEFWPVGSQNEITFWAPNRFMVDFVVDGERSVTTQNVEQVTGTTYMLPADVVRRGAAFGGWWTAIDGGARVLASTQVVLTRPHTFYARWTFNRYTVQFDANGGEGEMKSQGMAVDTACNLSECTFIRMGYAFMGWATEPDGEVMFSDATEVINLSYVQNAVVTLYAVWEATELTLTDVLCDDARAVGFSADSETDWVIDFTAGHDAPSARSGEIAAGENGGRTSTTLTAAVTGEGTGSFWWKVCCEDMDEEYGEWYDYAVFMVDGIVVAQIAGERDWAHFEFAVSGAGTHTLSWTFTRDDYDEDGATYENAAWVDGVIWMPRPVTVTFAADGADEGEVPEAIVKYQGCELILPGAGVLVNGTYRFVGWTDGVATYAVGSTYIVPATNVTLTAVWELKEWTLGEAVDAAALSFTTGGSAEWLVDASTGSTNGVAAKSGTVENGEASWIETTIHGGGTLAFHWNVMGGIYRNTPFAYAKVEVDGVQQAQEFNTEGWKEQTVEIDGAGAHTIRWTYLRTSARTVDVGDCAWLDEVIWMPSGGTILELTPAQAAAWVSEDLTARYAKSGESAADYQSRFEAKFGADPVAAMTMPTSKKDVHGNDMYVWQDYVAGTDPTDTNSVLTATITMVDGAPVVEWSPKLSAAEESRRRYTIYGKAGLESGEEWHSPTNARDRFFTVGVEMRGTVVGGLWYNITH